MNKLLFISVMFFGFSSTFASGASTSPNDGKKASDSTWIYQEELDKVLLTSPPNFFKLRIAFADSDGYARYANDDPEFIRGATNKLEEKKFEECLLIAGQILDTNYTSLVGQLYSTICNFELGHAKKGEYHRYVLNGLLDSISNSGDGKSTETAYIVISVSELRAFLQMKGFIIIRQALIGENDRLFDLMTVKKRETGEDLDLYFDVSITHRE